MGADRVSYAVASAKTFEGSYDLVCFFDCLHVRQHLESDGTLMPIELFAAGEQSQNLNPAPSLPSCAPDALCLKRSEPLSAPKPAKAACANS